jgi:hypothetical protein
MFGQTEHLRSLLYSQTQDTFPQASMIYHEIDVEVIVARIVLVT